MTGGIFMRHKEFIKILPSADTAVLFIHGIIGTPNFFNNFIPLIPHDWSICNLLLDGHGKGIDDFSKTSMDKWQAQVEEWVEKLCAEHKHIIIVGHSMGTLFAIQQGIRRPDKIKTLILLATPLKVFVKPDAFHITAKMFLKSTRRKDLVARTARKVYGIKLVPKPERYVGWIPRYLELFREIFKTRDSIAQLSVPCYVFQSKKDELVSMDSCKILETNNAIHITILENSSHFYYPEDDHKILITEFKKLIESCSNL